MNLACHTKLLQIYPVDPPGVVLISIPRNNTPALKRITEQKSSVTLIKIQHSDSFPLFPSFCFHPCATWQDTGINLNKGHEKKRKETEKEKKKQLQPTWHKQEHRNTHLRLNDKLITERWKKSCNICIGRCPRMFSTHASPEQQD